MAHNLRKYSDRQLQEHLVLISFKHDKLLAEMAKSLIRIEKNQTPVLDPEVSNAVNEQTIAVEAMKESMEQIQSSVD